MDSTQASKAHFPPVNSDAVGDCKEGVLEGIRNQYAPLLEQLAKHHIDPMNTFLLRDMLTFLEVQFKKGLKAGVSESAPQYRLIRPRIAPPLKNAYQCREGNDSLLAHVLVDIVSGMDGKMIQKDFCFFSIPVLTGSATDLLHTRPNNWMYEYAYDCGGYYLAESAGLGTASERIMPLNVYRRCNHPFCSSAKMASSSTDKKTASKSFAAASAHYQKHQRNNDEEEVDDGPSENQHQQQQKPDICMELRCLPEVKQQFYSTTSMQLVLTGYYVRRRQQNRSHQLYVLLPQFKPKRKPGEDAANRQNKAKHIRIPLLTVLLALNWTPNQVLDYLQIINHTWGHPDLRSMLETDRILHFVFQRHKMGGPTTSKEALSQIGRVTRDAASSAPMDIGTKDGGEEDKLTKQAHAMLCQQMLPFLGTDLAQYPIKARYLTYLFWLALMRMAGVDKTHDDLDHEANQRYETNAAAWGSLIRQCVKQYLTDAESALAAHFRNSSSSSSVSASGGPNWDAILKSQKLSKRLVWCLSTGIWSAKQITADTRRNMSMALSRVNDATYSSFIRRASTNIKAQDKSIKPRMLQISQYGRTDAADTSEGEKSGSVRMMTDGFLVSQSSPMAIFWAVVMLQSETKNLLTSYEEHPPCIGAALVLVNGEPKAWTRDPSTFCELIRHLRRTGRVHHEISVCWQSSHHQIVYILTEPGRSLRPLICLAQVGEWKSNYNYADLLLHGIAEHIDASEERGCIIAMSLDDLRSGREKFTHLELDPSLLFGNAMNTPFVETVQGPRITFEMNMNRQALATSIYNPLRCQAGLQLGLFYTHRPFVTSKGPNHGLNLIQAVATDVTDEDNMVFGTHLLQTGAFLGYQTRTYQSKDATTPSDVSPGTMLKEGDTLLIKADDSKSSAAEVKVNDEGEVLRVARYRGGTSRAWLTALIRILRGDKFSSRYGQKVTKSIDRLMADMMYDAETGETVDVITTLVSQPGRMTVGHLHELQVGNHCVKTATFCSAPAFATSKTFYTGNLLDSLKDYRPYTNGRSGRLMPCKIYTGVIYQMRLKHLVACKEHARGVGPVVQVTRQPTERRAQKSGLRLGEMERDCLIAYGAAQNAGERYERGSDPFSMQICKRCGIHVPKQACPICLQTSTVTKTRIAAGTKTLFKELEALGVMARFEVDHSPLFVKKLDDLFRPLPAEKQPLPTVTDDMLEQFIALCLTGDDSEPLSTTNTTTTTTTTNSTKSSATRKRTRRKAKENSNLVRS